MLNFLSWQTSLPPVNEHIRHRKAVRVLESSVKNYINWTNTRIFNFWSVVHIASLLFRKILLPEKTHTYKAYNFRLSEKLRPHLHEDGSTFCRFSAQFQNQSERGNDHVSHSGQPGDRPQFKYELFPNVWLHSSVGRASQRYRGGHGFESRWRPDFFRLLLSNCLN